MLEYMSAIHSFLEPNHGILLLMEIPQVLCGFFFCFLPADGHLSCLQFWAQVSKTIINIHVHIFVETYIYISIE